MIIYADTRQKVGKHDLKHRQIENQGFTLVSRALKTGDYMIDGNDCISVDTKQDLQEVYGNISNDKSRFMKEVRRAFNDGIKLIVLVEHGCGVERLEDVSKFKSKFGKRDGTWLMNQMYKISISYGTEFQFCNKNETGFRIIDILKNKN